MLWGRLAFGFFAEPILNIDAQLTAWLAGTDHIDNVVNRYEILDANVQPRLPTSWRMVRPSGQRHREHEGAGRPIHTMSRELELLAGRLCG
jgi:hypothetical protein